MSTRIVCVLACAIIASPVAQAAGIVIHQTADDLVASDPSGRQVFSARAFTAAQYRALLSELQLPAPGPNGASPLWVRHRIAFISLSGPLLAFRDEAEVEPGHDIPTGRTRFWTIDLRRPASYTFDRDDPLDSAAASASNTVIADLRALLPDSSLAAALAGTRLFQKLKDQPHATTDVALESLGTLGTTKPNCFEADAKATSSFAITQVAKSSATVQLGLPGQSYCYSRMTILTLVVPIAGLPAGGQPFQQGSPKTPATITFGTEPR